MRPNHPALDPLTLLRTHPEAPPSYNYVEHIFPSLFHCSNHSATSPDPHMEAHLALRGGAGLWVTNTCGLGIKSFMAPSRCLTIGAHEALTTELNHKEILAWCLHTDKVKRGNGTQPDKASVNQDRGCGRCPT